MKFARFPIRDAEGLILAHSITTRKGVIKKGRVLSAEDVARIAATGITSVMGARLEPGDVVEDAAAARVAHAVAGPGTRESAPFTGRANLFADHSGIAVVDAQNIARLNEIDEDLTIATVPPFERVSAGQMVATIKVITFAVPETAVAKAEAIAREARGLVRVAALKSKTAGLIMTRMPSTKVNVLEKRRNAIEARVVALGSKLGFVETVPHEEAAVKVAIAGMRARGADPIILFAASAIVDRGDVIPAALVEAGGEIVRLGMPVDPGNLMLLGRLDGRDVIGAPSCAASPKLNGFDWILERSLADLDIASRDVAHMGLGGLLKEIATRPQPREGEAMHETGEAESVRRAPNIGVVLLAAGRSTRFGASNKLLAELDGEKLVRRTARAILGSSARPVVAVTGHMADEVGAALAGLDLKVVHNPDFREGLSASMKAGLRALPTGLDGVIIALGDMPRVTGAMLDRLIAGFAPKEGRSIIVPVYQGKRGNPVLFSAELIPEMLAVAGDTGARHIIGQHAEEVAEVDLASDAIFVDVDTPEALARLKGP